MIELSIKCEIALFRGRSLFCGFGPGSTPSPDRAGAAVGSVVVRAGAAHDEDFCWPGAAGAIVGRAEDLNRFLQALLASELLKPETTLRQFTRLSLMFD
jgi:class 3 adenylate cyclase